MNIVEVLPSTSGLESEKPVPIAVVTRAQAQKEVTNRKDIERQVDSIKSVGLKSAKKAMRDKFRAQYHRKLKTATTELSKAQEQTQQEKGVSSSVTLEERPKEIAQPTSLEPREFTSRGSVLVEKKIEPLEAILKAYEARIDNREQTMENRWKTYPNAELEKMRQEMCKKMIETAQLLLEPVSSLHINGRIMSMPPNIFHEVERCAQMMQNDEEKMKEVTKPSDEVQEMEDIVNQRVENTTDMSFCPLRPAVPEVEENWPDELWEIVRDAKDGSQTWNKAPIEEIDFDKAMPHQNLQSMYGDQGTEVTADSRDEMLKELPSYLGPCETKSELAYLPSQKRARERPYWIFKGCRISCRRL